MSSGRFLLPILSAGFLAVSLTGAATGAPAGDGVLESISQEVNNVFLHAKDAVVKIEAFDEHGRLDGTGFFIDPNGTLYTSYTVGGESWGIVVCRGEAKYPAKRLLGDSRSGIAILQIQAETPFLTAGDVKDAVITTPVVAIGFPMDLPVTPNFGLLAGMDIKYLGRYFSTEHLRANVPVQRGEGGAPLLNLKGEVIGVLISSLDNGSGCFALPIDAAEKVRNDYMRFGEVRPGWIGLNVAAGTKAVEGSNAAVQDLVDGAPASKAGFQKGDILLKIGQRQIKAPEDVLNAGFFLTAGDDVPILVARGDKKVELKVLATKRPGPDDVAALPDPLLDNSGTQERTHTMVLKTAR